MKKENKIFSIAAFLILVAALAGCMAGKQLYPSAANTAAIEGSYTLMLYGCHYPEDITNVAILVSDASKYPVEINDIDTSYKIEKDVPAAQALRRADSFLRCTTHRIWQTVVRRIPDDSGGTIGYEVRPLYFPLEFGQTDVLLTSYALRDGKVKASIRLDPDVERMIYGFGDNEERGHK
jgi:hypothetical protein